MSEFRSKVTRPCKFAVFISSLSEDDRENLKAAMEATDIQTTDIRRWAAKRGELAAFSTIARHRKGECSCA